MKMTCTKKAKTALTAMLSLAAWICLSHYAHASLIVSHGGATDPATEGWTENGGDANISKTALSPDGTTGTDAWQIEDNSTGKFLYYAYELSEAQKTDAKDQGWEMAVTLRMPDSGQTASPAVGFDYIGLGTESKNAYRAFFGTTAGGDTEVRLGKNSTESDVVATLTGLDYHDYLFAFDPSTGDVSFSIDGTVEVAQVSLFELNSAKDPQIRFGSLSSADTGTGNWNEAQFTIIPEPASALLLALGAVALLKRRARRA